MEVKPEEILSLLEYFSKNTYKAKDTHPKVQVVMERCLGLFGLDYSYTVIPNGSGELSTNYPSSLVILEGEKGSEEPLTPSPNNPRLDLFLDSEPDPTDSLLKSVTNNSDNLDPAKLKELCSRARFARCRARFPVPVILYNQKHICRSATLSGGPEIYGRSSFDYFFSGGNGHDSRQGPVDPEEEIVVPETQSDWQLFDRVRSQDIRLLKSFQVHTIVDLMVEKKKVKFGVNVTSSEKVDKENRYSEFNLISLPYPGCEFFKDYRDRGYNAEDLVFEWNQGHVDANICVPLDPTSSSLNTDWSLYRHWDLVKLTQNYLRLLLAYVREGSQGLLVHCISGWDRTPLFISLLRLSLWADGVIHKSLSAEQILYLTIAYDWLLFGHNLEDRLSKGEEILFFCFYFLKYIVDKEFSVEDKPEVQKEISRVRNNSDIQLDGVLLEGDGNRTSPEGSNWSLTSCGSSQSSKSQDPPSYFQVVQESSWEDCKGVPHPLERHRHNSSHRSTAQNKALNCNGSHGGSRIPPEPSVNGSLKNPESAQASSHLTRPSPTISLSMSSGSSVSSTSKEILNGCSHLRHGRTSPVPVPIPSRVHHNSNHRPESTSSASIGSWQLITGTGSLRDTLSSTSEPSSTSSHSHPSRLPLVGAVECIEASESSCTLVEELTPVDFSSDVASMFSKPTNGIIMRDGKEEDCPDPLSRPDGLSFPSLNGSAKRKVLLPTQFKDGLMSKRRERLQTVRAHFYTLYASAIGFQFRSVNENGTSASTTGGGGLGFLIGNFATKVGIRSANRTTNL